jgi:hypothetical protein
MLKVEALMFLFLFEWTFATLVVAAFIRLLFLVVCVTPNSFMLVTAVLVMHVE